MITSICTFTKDLSYRIYPHPLRSVQRVTQILMVVDYKKLRETRTVIPLLLVVVTHGRSTGYDLIQND